MKNTRKRIFGPLTYGTLILGILIYGWMGIRPWLNVQYRCRSLYQELQKRAANTRDFRPEYDVVAELKEIGAPAGFWSGLAVRNPDPRVREIACGLIVKTIPQPSEAISMLIAAAQDDDPKVRQAAVRELADGRRVHGQQIPEKLRRQTIEILRARLKDPVQAVRSAAAAMGTAWPFEEVRPDLRAAMLDPQPEVRYEAGVSLYILEQDRDKKIQIVRTLFEDPDTHTGQGYLILNTLLDDVGVPSGLASVAAMLRSRNPHSRDKAINALLDMRILLSRGYSRWARSLSESRGDAHWFEDFGVEAICSKEILDGLAKLLLKPGSRSRLDVIVLLSSPPFQKRFQDQAAIESALLSMLKDRNCFLPPNGLDRTLLIHPELLPEAVSIVTRHLDDPEFMVRRNALGLLGLLGPGSQPAVPRLLEFWRKEPLYRA